MSIKPKFKIAVIQMNSGDNIKENLSSAESLIGAAAADGAKLVVLPEYSSYLSDHNITGHAEHIDGEIISFFRNKAKELNIYLHCGSFIEQSEQPSKAYNTSVLIDSRGRVVSCYRKIHLFDVYVPNQVNIKESNSYKAGSKIVTAETELGCFGFAICYDLRFPELFRALTDRGAGLIFVPAAFTLYTGKDHWEPLLRARAIENQVYVAAPGQFGVHPDHKTCFGGSMIIDPWGTVMARASEGVGYAAATIDWALQEKFREAVPSLKHRVLTSNNNTA